METAMKKLIALTMVLALTGCQTMSTKVNGAYVDNTPATAKQDKDNSWMFAVAAIAIGAGVGIAITSGDDAKPPAFDRDSYEACRAAGYPDSYCRQ